MRKRLGKKYQKAVIPDGTAPILTSPSQAPTEVAAQAPARHEGDNHSLMTERQLISLYYTLSLGSPPPSEWQGKNGTIPAIQVALRMKISKRKTIHNVIKLTYAEQLRGRHYDGKTHYGGGRIIEIIKGSGDERMIADYKESGMSMKDITLSINESRIERNEPTVGVNAVIGAFSRMIKNIVRIDKKSQGSIDPNSDWSRARYNLTTQMLLRFGKDPDLTDFYDSDGNLPNWFNKDMLTKIHPNSVTWWDEVHRECFVGELGAKMQYQCLFPRDADGNYDENGTYMDTAKECTFKYNTQLRLSLGASQKIENGVLVGKRLLPFDYTTKKLKSKSEWDVMEKIEIRRVKEEGGKEWIDSARPDGVKYVGDSPSVLPDVSENTCNALKTVGVECLGDMQLLGRDSVRFRWVMENMPKNKGGKNRIVSEAKMKRLIVMCEENVEPGSPPEPTDWRKDANPYHARYGDRWEEEMKKSKAFKPFRWVMELVEHIVVESKKFFTGTEHEDSWFFYHDALSIMTEKCTVLWMKEKDYYKHWILPQLGLNDDIGSYGGRPVGNSPEYMPWDASLNKDAHESVSRHCILSRATLKQQKKTYDVRQFSMATPTEGARAYHRILCPINGVAPSSKRIVQDIEGVFTAMGVVQANKGCYVHGLAERTGRRFITSDAHQQKRREWGGKRKRKDWSQLHLRTTMHPDLLDMREEEKAIKKQALSHETHLEDVHQQCEGEV